MDSSTVIGAECRFHRAGLVSCSLAGLSHMASQFNTVGRHRALLAFTLRAGLEAFAMQLGAGIAVVPEQRNGVVNLFCTANGRSHTRQWQMAKRDCCRKSSFFHTASSYSCDSLMAAVGHTSSQRPQKMQRPRLNCRQARASPDPFPPSARSTGRRSRRPRSRYTAAAYVPVCRESFIYRHRLQRISVRRVAGFDHF